MARPPAAPEGTVIQNADGSYSVKSNGRFVPSDASGKPAQEPLSGAPDNVARRQEYMAGMKQIAEATAGLRRTDGTIANMRDFDAVNSRSATGPIRIGGNLNPINWFDQQNNSDMSSAASRIQTGGVPQGQGAVSDYERRLYALGSPSVAQLGPTNRSLVNNAEAMRQEETDRIAYMQQYIARNGTLNGAEAKWRAYVAAQPYSSRRPIAGGGTQVFPNERRVGWQQYFGDGAQGGQPAPTARPATPPSGRPATPAPGARPTGPTIPAPATSALAGKPDGSQVDLRDRQTGRVETYGIRGGKVVRLR